MVDFIYNVIRRPIANEPDKKDIYHVDKAPKDARAKRIEEDDPNKEQGKRSFSEEHEQQKEHQSQTEQIKENNADKSQSRDLTPKLKGRGKYLDEDGNERLDFYA